MKDELVKKGLCPDSNCNEMTVNLLREQRHDFMNHIQVIWGYLQLNKASNAVKYIIELNKKMDSISRLFSIDSAILSLYLYDNFKKAYDKGLLVEFNYLADSIKDEYIKTRFEDKLYIMDKIFDEVIEGSTSMSKNILYINVIQKHEVLEILISNKKCSTFSESADNSCEHTNHISGNGIDAYIEADNSYIKAKVVLRECQ